MKRILSILIALVISTGMLNLSDVVKADGQSAAGIVATESGCLNVRSGPTTTSTVVGALNKGSYVTLISQTGSWWYLEYADGKYGYSHADYIQPLSSTAAMVQTQSGNLNVRNAAGAGSSIVGSLAKGESVLVLSSVDGWSRILYQGTKVGYVSGRYLSYSSGSVSTVLNVPSYKQTDSRWANVQIGSSGKTIAQIGCATTAVAMMESYRQWKTIYPDAMSYQLSYSSTGNLYWPSHYQVVHSSEQYLSRIYNLLRQGKPVLFGAKKSNGSQHWVVISGYTGGDALTASGFVIRDPGSNSRTTLQQFLNEYPVFYKYFYY